MTEQHITGYVRELRPVLPDSVFAPDRRLLIALLATIAATIDDPNVAAACKPIASFATEYKKQVAQDDAAMHASIDKVVAALPAEVEQLLRPS